MSDLGPDLRTAERPGDSAVLAHVLDLIQSEGAESWALEFGVGSGASLAMIAGVVPVIGFDSFQGLPEDWRPGFSAGMFAQSKIPQIENATVCVGWFEDTLPAFDWPESVSLIHFDADLYSSTKTILEHAGYLIQPGVYLVFDEYHGYADDVTGEIPGEQRAFQEWALEHSLAYKVIGHGREQFAIQVISFGAIIDA